MRTIRTAITTTLCVLLLMVIGTQSLLAVMPEAPNFVIVMADDMGYGDLACYGGSNATTPHLDGMAKAGLKFTDFHSSGAVCSPTRAGLLTGRYQQRAGIPGVVTAKSHRHVGLAPSETTFAETLKQAGYATAIFGKWHVGYQKKFNPVHQGFDQFRGYVSGNVDYFSHIDQTGVYDWWDGDKLIEEEGYVTHLITRHAVDFIRKNKDRRFCLYLSHEAVHSPYQGPGDKADRKVGVVKRIAGSRTDVKQAYHEMMEELDKSVGAVLAELEKHQLASKTLVWFFSDNGANPRGSNGAFRGFKASLWEGGHRVPGIAYWPSVIKPGETSATTITLDVFPTLLEIAGVAKPAGLEFDGTSLAPLLLNRTPPAARKLFWGTSRQRAMRDGEWKLVTSAGNGKAAAGKLELFNLAKDQGETNNLASRYKDRVQRMQAAIAAWNKDVGPSSYPDIVAPERRRREKN